MSKKKVAGLQQVWTMKDINKSLVRFANQNIETQIKVFNYIGQSFINNARDNGDYFDDTGNLRSSIGYVVAVNGKIKDSVFKAAGKDLNSEGVNSAKRLSQSLISNNGVELIVTAGMDYAKAVESKKYNVLTIFAPSKSQLAKDFKIFLSKL